MTVSLVSGGLNLAGPSLWVIVMDDLLCRLSNTSSMHLSGCFPPGKPPFTVEITNAGLRVLGVYFSPDGTCSDHVRRLKEDLELVPQHLRTIGNYLPPANDAGSSRGVFQQLN